MVTRATLYKSFQRSCWEIMAGTIDNRMGCICTEGEIKRDQRGFERVEQGTLWRYSEENQRYSG